MPPPSRLTFRQALDDCPVTSVKQGVWRGHNRAYEALHHGGSLRGSGRFHRAASEFPEDQSWPALYTALDLAVSLGEVQRNTHGKRWHEYRFTEIWAQLEAVVDCRDLDALGLTEDSLLDDMDYTIGQELAAAAVGLGVEGMLVPSATRLGDNLIVFPHLVRRGSVLVVVRSLDPRLIK